MQKVYLSRTISGAIGLFTDGYLVTSVSDLAQFLNDPNAYCKRRGFEYVGNQIQYHSLEEYTK